MKRIIKIILLSLLISFLSTGNSFAHCDTMDGPVVTDARRAIDSSNVNYVLKWVKPEYEKDVRGVFFQVILVRTLSPESQQLADMYFFETVVKLHRLGEGIPFTYIKPSGTPVDKRIIAADKSIEQGDLSPLKNLLPEEKLSELKVLFDRVMLLKDFDINDVAAGRKYVEAYVRFFHFAENYETHNPSLFRNMDNPNTVLPWTLAGFFLLTSLITLVLYLRRRNYRYR